MKIVKILMGSIASLLLSLLLIGCSKEASDKDTLIVATSADNPPYEFIQNGQIIGLDIDIINVIAQQMGKKIVIKNLDVHGLFAALASKNIDLVIAGISVTPERKKNIDFSDVYTSATVALLYRTKDTNPTDLSGKIIGAALGTTWNQVAKDLADKYKGKVHTLANNLMLVEELKSKAIDAVILEEAQVKQFIANNPGLGSLILEDFSSEFAIAFPQGSALRTPINNAIKSLEDDGTLDAIRKKWLE